MKCAYKTKDLKDPDKKNCIPHLIIKAVVQHVRVLTDLIWR